MYMHLLYTDLGDWQWRSFLFSMTSRSLEASSPLPRFSAGWTRKFI